jgi:hypothetical protein
MYVYIIYQINVKCAVILKFHSVKLKPKSIVYYIMYIYI